MKHKFISSFLFLIIVLIGFWLSDNMSGPDSSQQYMVASAKLGTLKQTITGTGQVSASNQTDIQSQVSGTILSINVKVGQTVSAGDLIAMIDYRNAINSVQNARISLAKLTEPAKDSDIRIAENNVTKSYEDAYSAASATYTDLSYIMPGLKDLLYGTSGYLNDQKSPFYTLPARTYRENAGQAYDLAAAKYETSLAEFKSLNRTSLQEQLNQLYADTYETIKLVTEAIDKSVYLVTYLSSTQPSYNPSGATSASSNLSSWSNQAKNDLANILSSKNSTQTTLNTLANLKNGSDELDIESARINLEQAQRNYDNYFIKAPYDGTIARIPVNVYGQAGNGTTIATIIGKQKIANISLNEVDAAKVKNGQKVLITFDAVDGLNATGTVEQIDQIGTVSQGVVSYAVKILIDTEDDRIKPGMSVNTTIITNEKENVLLVPTSAIKSQGNQKYVQIFDRSEIEPENKTGTSLGSLKVSGSAPSTTQRTSQASKQPSSFTFTVSPSVPPKQVFVEIGESDDNNTIIMNGLNAGQFVVTRTISGSSSQTATPNILTSMGGRTPGSGAAAGGTRTITR